MVDVPPAPTVWYVTDPICGACWAFEPVWRRFRHHYGDLVDVRTVYGGLLPGWDGFADEAAHIRRPEDVPAHWAELELLSGQKIDSSVWLRDPIPSSYPPSVAATAVRLVAPAREDSYLRALREDVFVHGRNIARPEVYLAAADLVGVDVSAVRDRIADGSAAAEFDRDRALTSTLGAPGFPTVVISAEGRAGSLFGVQPYRRLEALLLDLTGWPPRRSPPDATAALASLGTGTAREYAELLELTTEQAADRLEAAGAYCRTEDGALWCPADGADRPSTTGPDARTGGGDPESPPWTR